MKSVAKEVAKPDSSAEGQALPLLLLSSLRTLGYWSWPAGVIVVLLSLAVVALYQTQIDYRFKLGLEDKSPALSGFYGPEKNPNFDYRWSYPTWKLDLPLLGRRPYQIELTALSLQPAPVEVRDAKDILVGTFTPATQIQTYRLEISPDAVYSGDLHLKCQIAAFQPDGGRDHRDLGLLVTQLDLKSQRGLVIPPWRALGGIVGLGLAIYGLSLRGLSLVIGRRPPRLWVFGLGLGSGLMACEWLAVNRSGFAAWGLPLALNLEVAAGLIYFFRLGSVGWGLLVRPQPQYFQSKISQTKAVSSLISSIGLPLILALGFGLRVINLAATPLFTDEALHIRAGLVAMPSQNENLNLFDLAIDGKILHGWLLAALYTLINDDSIWLLIARLLSAVCGMVIILVGYKLAESFFSRRAGLIAAGLCTIVPFMVWHNRLALVDNLMVACGGLSLYFTLQMLAAKRDWHALKYGGLAGLALGAAILTKLPALLLIVGPGLALLLLYRPGQWAALGSRLGWLYAVTWLTAGPIIRLYSGSWGGDQQDGKFALPEPGLVWENLALLGQWSYAYFTLPLLGLVLVGASWATYRQWRIGLFLLLLAAITGLFFAGFARIWFARYLLPALLPLIVLAAGGVEAGLLKLQTRRQLFLGLAGLGLLALPALWFDVEAIAAPLDAPLPAADRFQYLEGWPAGTGLEQIENFLMAQQSRTDRPITIFATALIPYDGLNLFLGTKKTPHLIYAQPDPERVYNALRQALTAGPVFLVTNEPRDQIMLENYKLTFASLNFQTEVRVSRPGNQSTLVIYRLTGLIT